LSQNRTKLPSMAIIEGSFGITASETQLALQQEAYKEVVNKLAWALGSAYGRPYSNKTMIARKLALEVAVWVVQEVGWPASIRKKPPER